MHANRGSCDPRSHSFFRICDAIPQNNKYTQLSPGNQSPQLNRFCLGEVSDRARSLHGAPLLKMYSRCTEEPLAGLKATFTPPERSDTLGG